MPIDFIADEQAPAIDFRADEDDSDPVEEKIASLKAGLTESQAAAKSATRKANAYQFAENLVDLPRAIKTAVNVPYHLAGGKGDMPPLVSPEQVQAAREFLANPTGGAVQLPDQQPSPVEEAVERGLDTTVSGLSSPENVALALLAKKFPTGVSAYFEGQTLGAIPESTQRVLESKSLPEAAEALVPAVANVAGSAVLGRHLAGPMALPKLSPFLDALTGELTDAQIAQLRGNGTRLDDLNVSLPESKLTSRTGPNPIIRVPAAPPLNGNTVAVQPPPAPPVVKPSPSVLDVTDGPKVELPSAKGPSPRALPKVGETVQFEGEGDAVQSGRVVDLRVDEDQQVTPIVQTKDGLMALPDWQSGERIKPVKAEAPKAPPDEPPGDVGGPPTVKESLTVDATPKPEPAKVEPKAEEKPALFYATSNITGPVAVVRDFVGSPNVWEVRLKDGTLMEVESFRMKLLQQRANKPPTSFSWEKSASGTDQKNLSYAGILETVDSFQKQYPNIPKIVVVATKTQLHPDVLGQLRTGFEPAGSRVKWPDGTSHVIIVADRITSAARLQAILAHEAIGHHGLEEVMGDAFEKLALDTEKLFKQKPDLVRHHQSVVEAYGDNPLTIGKELLARMAESQSNLSNPTLWEKVVSTVSKWWRDHIDPNHPISLAEIRKALISARKFVEKPAEAGVNEAPRTGLPRVLSEQEVSKAESEMLSKVTEKGQSALWQEFVDEYGTGALRRKLTTGFIALLRKWPNLAREWKAAGATDPLEKMMTLSMFPEMPGPYGDLMNKVSRLDPELGALIRDYKERYDPNPTDLVEMFAIEKLRKYFDEPLWKMKAMLHGDWPALRSDLFQHDPNLAMFIDREIHRRSLEDNANSPHPILGEGAVVEGGRSTSFSDSGRRQSLGIAAHGHQLVTAAMQWVHDAPTKFRVMLAQMAGKAAAHTSTASEASGNALVHYASAKIASPVVARSMATDVLGDHHRDPVFGAKLGAVLVEDRLRAIRAELTAAGDPGAALVETVIGKPWSPLHTTADFDAALLDPEIQSAIDRHKASIQPVAQAAHLQARGELSGAGLHTGAFVNLKAILDTPEAERFGQAGRGVLDNPLRRLSRFFRQARGTAAKYEIDYRTLAQRMIEGNFEESAKRTMYDQLVHDGLAVVNNPGDPRPTIGRKPPVKFTVDRRGVPVGGGHARTYVKNLWVRADIASEVRQALNTDGKVAEAGLANVAHFLTRLQLAGPTDAVWHTANMLGSIAGSQGGRTVLTDLARKLPGVNLADAIGRVTASGIKVLRDNPEVQQQLSEIARIGALRGEHPAGWLGNAIQFIDKAGRLVRDDMYNNLVQRGLVTATEAGRREWINQMGQYNGRLMGQFQRFFKESGFSPFIVAGRNFNRMAMRRMALSPGVEASSPMAAAQMRGVEAMGMLATLVVIPSLANYVLTGSPSGRAGVKFGQIDTGKNDKEGKAIVIDPAQWIGLRRGLRMSGAQAVIEGVRHHEGAKAITRTAAHDIGGAILHPWTGPAVTAPVVGMTGYDPRFYKESVNPKDVGENVKAALKQLNPVASAAISAHEKDTVPGVEMVKSLGGAFGVKTVKAQAAREQLRDAHSAWLRTNKDPKVAADYQRNVDATYPTSKYKDADDALKKSNDKAAMEALQALRQQEGGNEAADNRIFKRFQKASVGPVFHESWAHENAFKATLTPEQGKLYDAAKKERQATFDRFLALWGKRNAKG